MREVRVLDRVSVSVTLTTIIAILAKLGLLYSSSHEAWFDERFDLEVVYFVLVGAFLIFFRGKMMHDDSVFFEELKSSKFKKDAHAKARTKSGLLLGYLSWFCWAPAIYFLERPSAVGWWLVISLALSTLWLVADIATRTSGDDPELKKRYVFLVANVAYAIPLVLLGTKKGPPAVWVGALLVILVIDWLKSDTLSTSA
jgi:uncharacterized membrane protein SirB2